MTALNSDQSSVGLLPNCNTKDAIVPMLACDTVNHVLKSDQFSLTLKDHRLMNRFFNQHCISLVLGIAEGTYGADRTVNSLHDLMLLVLRERGGNQERLGLIEHAVSPKA